MTARTAIEKGREAFARGAWARAYRHLAAAHARSPLVPADLEQLAIAAYLTGRESEAIAAWTSLQQELAAAGRPDRAARWAFWISLALLFSGERAQSTGWLGRMQRLLKEHAGCAEQGLLQILVGLSHLARTEADRALACFERAGSVARRFPDDDLVAFSLLSRGQALIQLQRPADGAALLDEAMVTVLGGSVSPMASGVVYCAVILTSQRIFDLERAREWTAALDSWCAGQPDLAQFRGQCLVHRSEILTLQGDWPAAAEEVRRGCAWYAERTGRPSGRAFYQLAELHRLRGELDAADRMYGEAGRHGMEPQPGLSLLRLAQGDVETAAASIRRVVGEAGGRQGPGGGTARATFLGPYVEILIAAGDLEAARAGTDELSAVAAALDAPLLHAQSAQWRGAVTLAGGDAHAALAVLREAWAWWQRIQVPYESARVQVLIGEACARLGDADTADQHLRAARAVFERLGARPALAGLEAGSPKARPPAGLTPREGQVLALVARGKTNRRIAAELGISEHTVARHLGNIFTKLDVSSRTAAAAFAHQHGLV